MKINLPIFKDEDTKDVVTYQSWRLDFDGVPLCRMQRSYTSPICHPFFARLPWELVWSLGMDITLDNMLTILDEHNNNVKALDTLNQELFQLWMVDKGLSQIGESAY